VATILVRRSMAWTVRHGQRLPVTARRAAPEVSTPEIKTAFARENRLGRPLTRDSRARGAWPPSHP
jgi:hypothetical protein